MWRIVSAMYDDCWRLQQKIVMDKYETFDNADQK